MAGYVSYNYAQKFFYLTKIERTGQASTQTEDGEVILYCKSNGSAQKTWEPIHHIRPGSKVNYKNIICQLVTLFK